MTTSSISRRSVLTGAATGAALGLRPLAASAADATRFVVRVDRDVENLDPPFRTGQADGNVLYAVFQRLISPKPNTYEWELDAARSIEQVSPTEIAFTLKPGQTFTDGYGEMTADDVKFSFERYLKADPNGRQSSYREDWEDLVEVRVTDTYSGSLRLKRPAPGIWAVALAGGSGAIMSRKAVEALGAKHSQSPVGSGPYRVSSFQPRESVTLTRNADFKGAKPDFETCVVRFISNVKTAELALRGNEIDFTELPLTSLDAMKNLANVRLVDRPGQRFVWLGMNVTNKALSDIRVRQAIRAALDVDQMVVGGYQGLATRLDCMIPQGLDGHWAQAPSYKRDVGRARDLLKAAGVARPRFRLTILNQPAFQNMALVAQAQLAEAGIDVDVDQRDGGAYWSSGKGEAGKTVELFILRFNAHVDPNFNTRWFLPGQIGEWNWQRWNNADYARLHEESATNLDPRARVAQVIEMQKLMDESAAFVWLTNEAFAFGYRPSLAPAMFPNGNNWQLNHFKKTA